MNNSNVTDHDNITDYNIMASTNCTNNEIIATEIAKPLITIIPCELPLICLISLIVYTLVKPLFNKENICQIQMMEKFLYPSHPIRCIITGRQTLENQCF